METVTAATIPGGELHVSLGTNGDALRQSSSAVLNIIVPVGLHWSPIQAKTLEIIQQSERKSGVRFRQIVNPFLGNDG